MAAAGADDDSGAGGFFFWRKEYSDGRVVDGFHPVVFCFLGDITPVLEAGGAVGPEGDLPGSFLGSAGLSQE